MRKSQLINQVIMSSGLAESVPEANRIFVQTFVEHYLELNLEEWDTEVPHAASEEFRQKIGSGRGISVRYLIKDLDIVLKKKALKEQEP